VRRYLVAGGAGFIGSHVVELLLDRGDAVVAVDSLVTGSPANLAAVHDHPRFELVTHDVREPVTVDGPFDVVMNLASPASPSDFARLSVEILETGSVGSRHLLDAARASGARYFLASTSEVYGDPLVHPQPESYWGNVDPTGPRSCYDEAKRYSEALTMAYHRRYGISVGIARIFNTYGPRMRPDDGRVVTNFVMAALRGNPLELYGSGAQTRSFCYVADEAAGLVALADSAETGPINIGNPGEFTMRQLAELVVALTGSASPIVEVPLPPERRGDPNQRRPDITLARSRLGWEPTTDLETGLARTIDWLRRHT
jgi:dTDP-glucose 4,6-dehydratase